MRKPQSRVESAASHVALAFVLKQTHTHTHTHFIISNIIITSSSPHHHRHHHRQRRRRCRGSSFNFCSHHNAKRVRSPPLPPPSLSLTQDVPRSPQQFLSFSQSVNFCFSYEYFNQLSNANAKSSSNSPGDAFDLIFRTLIQLDLCAPFDMPLPSSPYCMSR